MKRLLIILGIILIFVLTTRIRCGDKVYQCTSISLSPYLDIGSAKLVFFSNIFGKKEVVISDVREPYSIEYIYLKGINKKQRDLFSTGLKVVEDETFRDSALNLRSKKFQSFGKLTVLGVDLSFLLNKKPIGFIYYRDGHRELIQL